MRIVNWLLQLQEPERTQAIVNCDEDSICEDSHSLESALSGAFFWSDSPQGHEYWDNIYDQIISKEYTTVDIEDCSVYYLADIPIGNYFKFSDNGSTYQKIKSEDIDVVKCLSPTYKVEEHNPNIRVFKCK